MKPQLEYAIVKLRPEAMFVRVFPLPVYDFEGNVLCKQEMKKNENLTGQSYTSNVSLQIIYSRSNTHRNSMAYVSTR